MVRRVRAEFKEKGCQNRGKTGRDPRAKRSMTTHVVCVYLLPAWGRQGIIGTVDANADRAIGLEVGR
jgi:hypothetical protein